VQVDPATRAAPVNGTFTVNIVANVGTEMDATEPNKTGGLGAYEFDLVYDTNYLEAVSVSDAGGLGSTNRTVSALGPNIDNPNGRTTFAAYSYPPLDVSGPGTTVVLATVTLKAKRAGVTTLNLENALLTDTQANAWPDVGAGRVLNTSGVSIFVFLTSDFDGDGKADPAAFDPDTGEITVRRSNSGYDSFSLLVGDANSIPTVADFDGDGKADPAAFDPDTGKITVRRSNFGYDSFSLWVGDANSIPTVADFDGDGKADPAAFDPDTGKITVRRSSFGYDWFSRWVGDANSIPTVADFDGDGKADPAAFDPDTGKITVRRSSFGYDWFSRWVGDANSTPTVADFDADGKADPAAFDPDTGKITARRSKFGYDWLSNWVGDANATPVAYWRLW
jgi:uncharacterized iron-regulated membrane protein